MQALLKKLKYEYTSNFNHTQTKIVNIHGC
jgi:hypothetical protein